MDTSTTCRRLGVWINAHGNDWDALAKMCKASSWDVVLKWAQHTTCRPCPKCETPDKDAWNWVPESVCRKCKDLVKKNGLPETNNQTTQQAKQRGE